MIEKEYKISWFSNLKRVTIEYMPTKYVKAVSEGESFLTDSQITLNNKHITLNE